ncbi:MAG: hypothetical protein A3H35_01310 [Betaproteobacteria bacterium RIFCSPLOWO2_02_FULL_62_17]|nr:MAG: hypothetical protein A3H35_01310 [Betaproteobacteria bacterium RIFCSPLOWO2_02_FULL_62_17]
MRHYPAMMCLLAVLGAFSAPVFAQGFPIKPLRMVIPFPPGGIDTQARVLAQKMADDLGQPVVVENRAGANGNIGSENVARSAPDGYSMLFTSSSTMIIGPFVSKNAPLDPFKDFTPILNVYESTQTLAVPTSLPVNSVKELVAHARRNPGKLSYSSSGVGSWVHLTAEVFKQVSGTDIVHVPYKGTGPMVADLAAGRVEVSFPSYATAQNFLAAGKVKIIALAAPARYSGLPEIPTIGETFPAFQRPPTWIALFGPAAMPQPVLRRLATAGQKALESAELRSFYAKSNAVIVGGTPEDLAATMRSDWDITARLVKTLGIKPE